MTSFEILNKFEVLEGVQEYMEHELIRLEDVYIILMSSINRL